MLYKSLTNRIKQASLSAKTVTGTLAAAITICTSQPAAAQTAPGKAGIFYAVSGNGLKDTSWLFGTYHLVKSSYLSKAEPVNAAFKKAHGVVVEIVMDSSVTALAQKAGMLQHKTLRSLLPEPFADSLDAELKTELGVGIAQLNSMKPISVMLTLSMVYAMKHNSNQLQQYTGLPLDINFVSEGRKTGKTITALETAASQMNLLFDILSEAGQADQLQLFLRNKEAYREEGNKLLDYWLKQDGDNMYAVIERSRTLYGQGNSDYMYLINEARNNEWMKKLPGLLAQQSQFIAVGALHLAGPNGLPAQLQAMGYTVTPIKF